VPVLLRHTGSSDAALNEPVALKLDRLTKSFGGLLAVDGVELAVRPGERRAIIGPNGAGKTTLFNLITGEIPVSSGAVHLFGRDITGLPPHRRVALGLARTFQITNLFPGLSVLENGLLAVQGLTRAKFAMLRPRHRFTELKERAMAALQAVGLEHRADAVVKNLSHGEQRQLEIALTLAAQPRVLLLDEPTAGLSPAESQLMADLLHRLDPAMTILIIEHDMDIALLIAERVTVLHYGRVIADGSRDDVKADPLVREIYLGV
jgi:branched-chain amino acid transport system ATP-binding protein